MIQLTQKQSNAWHKLNDSTTEDILYGGFAGGGKSFLGCLWIDYMARTYDRTRYLIGRSVLKDLKKTTVNTYFEVLAKQGRDADSVKYNQQDQKITYPNGSEILLYDLAHKPSDPFYTGLGSLEITAAFIDEANQITDRARQVVKSRIRHKLQENGLIPTLLMTCNPAKNWTYLDFYKPWKDGKLEPHKAFIDAKATDNPYLDPSYVEGLKKLTDRVLRERLLHGNWDYDSNPARLMDFDSCTDIFTNESVPQGQSYITADIARFGKDKTVVGVWSGYRLEHVETMATNTIPEAAQLVRELATRYNIPMSRTLVDEDGIGGGVKDMLGCKGFIANTSSKKNYQNIKSECYYALAEKVAKREMLVRFEDHDTIIQELQAIERGNMGKDTKLSINSKDSQKEILNRSPDYADMIMMRMWFDCNKMVIHGFA